MPSLKAPDKETEARWHHSGVRHRLLEGLWLEDLERAIVQEVGENRAEHWGTPDLTKNVARSVVYQLSITYDRDPIVMHEDPEAVELMESILDEAGVWSLATRMQRLTIGMRECAFYVRTVKGKLVAQVVSSDVLWAEADPATPDEPHTVHWYRLRPHWDPEVEGDVWTRDVWSIKGGVGVFRIEAGWDGNLMDVTGAYVDGGQMVGDEYPIIADGMPALPWVLYHAERTGCLWDAFEGIELFEGALKVALFWTFWGHILKDASHPQRYAINAMLLATTADEHGNFIETDPSTLLMLRAATPGATPAVGQWQPGGDPLELGEAIRAYSADLAVDFGISPSDIQRSGGDARSGYAIFLTREGVRSAQRRMEPQFRRGDRRLLSVVAAVWNADDETEGTLPVVGWDIAYRGLPLSIEERRALMEESEAQIAAGIMSKVDLYALMNSVTDDQAREQLRKRAADFREFP